MKLTDLQLERYGIYEQTSWQPPETGLCIVMGENESGKTTLMQFIRDMLFGYRRGKRQGRYGNLALCRDNGRCYRIYRHEGETRVLDENGDKLRGEPAELWWHGMDRNTYEHVFAIGLEDLQGAEILAKDDVRSRFLSVRGGEQLADTQQYVNEELESLLVASPQGKRKINLLLNRLKEAELAVEALADQEEEFAAVRKEQREVEEQIARTEENINALQIRDRNLDKQLGAWKYYENGIEIKRRLDLCSKIHSFPEDGKERWNDLMQRMAVIKEKRDEIVAKMEPLQPKTADEVNEWREQGDEIIDVYAQAGSWREWERELAAKEAEIAAWEQDYRELAMGYKRWDNDETVGKVDWNKGRELAKQMRQRDNEIHFWRTDEPKIECLEDEDIEIPRVTTEEEFRAFDQRGQEMLSLAREKEHLNEEIEWLEEQPDKRYSVFFWIGFLLVLAAGGVFYLFYTGDMGVDAPYVAAGLLAASLLCFYINYRRSHSNEYRLEKLRRRMADIIAAQEQADDELALGIPGTQEEMAHFAGVLETVRRDFYRYQARLQARSWQEESCRRQIEEHHAWEKRGEKLMRDREVTAADWHEWLAENNLPDIEADQIEELHDEWQDLFTQRGRGQILRVQKEKLKEKLNAAEERAAQLLVACGSNAPPTPDAVTELYEKYREKELAWQSAKEKNAHYDELAREKAMLDERWTLCENEMKALFALVDANDAQEFADKVTAYEQCDELRKEYERIRQNMRLYAGSEEEFERLWRQLETGEYELWLQRHKQYENSLRMYREELAELRRRQGALTNEIGRLVADDSLAKALQKRSAIRAELDEELDNYLVLAFTDMLLDEARHEYEAGSRPEVLRQAGEFLQAMTSGRYTLTADSEGTIRTVDTAHEHMEAEMWSSGTGDQVYLSLRLALALAFAERTEVMPIVLDDIFVRFDEVRQKETLRFLFDFARERQVFLFTCHARTAELAKEADSENRGHYYRLTTGTIAVE